MTTVLFPDQHWCRHYGTPCTNANTWNECKLTAIRLYVYKKAGAMTGHRFTDDVAIVFAESLEDAIKTFSKLYADVTEDEVEPVIFNSKDIAILTDY